MIQAILLALFLFVIPSAYATELYEDTTLLLESNIQAKEVGIAAAGEVIVLERKGFWVKIQASKSLLGWTQLSQLHMQEEIEWMRPIDTLHDTGRLTGQ